MDLNGIDLNLLVAFDALMAERNVTRAGARIHRTQPAMSAALSRLRALFKDELFVRGAHGLQPTPRALELGEPLSRALNEIQRTLDFTQHFDPSTSSATFSLGMSDHPTFVLLPRILEALRAQAPSVTLRIRSFVARDDAVTLLDASEIDLALGVPSTQQSGRILTAELFEERFVCVLRKGHPAARGPLTLSKFISLSHLLVSPENERYGHVDAALAQLGVKRRLGLTLPHMYAAPLLVSRSDLIATLMEGVIRASGYGSDLTVLKPPVELAPIPFVMSWHRRNDTHPAQSWFRSCIAELCKTAKRSAVKTRTPRQR